MNATKIITPEIKDKKLIRTLCNKKIQTSEIYSLIIDYDKDRNQMYYDHEAMTAIAASQMDIIKKEITDYEEEIKKLRSNFTHYFKKIFLKKIRNSNMKLNKKLFFYSL